ncbi:MAG: hypothetical protein IJX26_02005 [Clostridia bacterium]|nr:hypothetical protein [Clostridia bacterium]
MKKIIPILIICFVLPVLALTLSACKNKSNNILNFYSTYLSTVDDSKMLITASLPDRFENDKIKKVGFNYSNELNEKISNITAFSYTKTLYEVALDDALGPMYLYSNSLIEAKLSKKQVNSLYEKLDDLQNNIISTAEKLNTVENTQNNETALQNLMKFYSSFEDTITVASNLSGEISRIYFNKVLINSNPNYSTKTNQNIDLESVAISTKNRLIYYKSIYVDVYFKTKIVGHNIPLYIINGNSIPTYEPYEYFKNTTYSTIFSESAESYRNELYNLAISLFEIQLYFDSEYQKYQTAINKINYHLIDQDNPLEIGYKNIVDKFSSSNGILYASFNIIKNILNYCY